MKVIRNVPRGQGFLFSTEKLEGDNIGCISSVMIKMADSTNVHGTTEGSVFHKEFKAKEAARK